MDPITEFIFKKKKSDVFKETEAKDYMYNMTVSEYDTELDEIDYSFEMFLPIDKNKFAKFSLDIIGSPNGFKPRKTKDIEQYKSQTYNTLGIAKYAASYKKDPKTRLIVIEKVKCETTSKFTRFELDSMEVKILQRSKFITQKEFSFIQDKYYKGLTYHLDKEIFIKDFKRYFK